MSQTKQNGSIIAIVTMFFLYAMISFRYQSWCTYRCDLEESA